MAGLDTVYNITRGIAIAVIGSDLAVNLADQVYKRWDEPARVEKEATVIEQLAKQQLSTQYKEGEKTSPEVTSLAQQLDYLRMHPAEFAKVFNKMSVDATADGNLPVFSLYELGEKKVAGLIEIHKGPSDKLGIPNKDLNFPMSQHAFDFLSQDPAKLARAKHEVILPEIFKKAPSEIQLY